MTKRPRPHEARRGQREYIMTIEQTAKTIIQHFNFLKKITDKFTDTNVGVVTAALMAGYSDIELRKAAKEYDGNDLKDCYNVVRLMNAGYTRTTETVEAAPVVVEAPAPAPIANPAATAASSLGLLEQAMAQIFTDKHADSIRESIQAKAMESFKTYIAENYGPIVRKVEWQFGEKKVDFGQELLHEKFETVLKFVQADEPVFLTGPAGSGKNVICKQVAKAMGVDFYFSNAVTQEYKITGFTDAMGVFQESQFYKAFKNGGLFMLDEMDTSIPEVLVILNAAIANRYFDFPAPIGYVEAHENFRVVAAGNTCGTGASYQYVGRNQLDGASLDRFAVVEITYSEAIEDAVGGVEIAGFCRDFRAAAAKAGSNVIVSYRAIGRLAKMVPALGLEDAIRTCLTKGMEKDDILMIVKEIPTGGKFRTALAAVAQAA
jgi:cobaltochelatase CobS